MLGISTPTWAQTIYYGGACGALTCAAYTKEELCKLVMVGLNTPTVHYKSPSVIIPFSSFPEGGCQFYNLDGASKGQYTSNNGISTTCSVNCGTPATSSTPEKVTGFLQVPLINGSGTGITQASSTSYAEYQVSPEASNIFIKGELDLTSIGTGTGEFTIQLPFSDPGPGCVQGIGDFYNNTTTYSPHFAPLIEVCGSTLYAFGGPNNRWLTNADLSNTSILSYTVYIRQ